MSKEKFQSTDNPLLDEILQKYRDCSTDSISGPRGFGEPTVGNKKPWTVSASDIKRKHFFVSSTEIVRPPHNDIVRSVATKMYVPAKDQGTLKFKETLVDHVPLACFSYGGEKRLCFKDLVEKVLKGFTTQAINNARDRLQIFCPRCTPQQLEILKLAGVLPWSCTSAGLITKTDAFRLIGALSGSSFPRKNSRIFSVESLEVYHECFGGCVGTLDIEAYSDPYAECVTCAQCDGVFSPRTFVTHSHSAGEVHTCHWGFDSANWRLYLMLCNDHPTIHVQRMWETLTSKFTEGNRRRFKREYTDHGTDEDYTSRDSRNSPSSFPVKKPRQDSQDGRSSLSPNHKETEERYVYCSNGIVTTCSTASGDIMSRRSAFRPWSPINVNANKQNGRPAISNGKRSPDSPARIFTPGTVSVNIDHRGPNKSPPQRKQPAHGSSSTSPVSRSEEKNSSPSNKDLMSFEKTAKDMLHVVSQDNHGLNAFEEAYSHLQNGSQSDGIADKLSISEEDVYQLLSRHSRNGELPNIKDLSEILAKDLKGILQHNESKVKRLLIERDKLEEVYEATKRDHATRVDELFDELRQTKKELRLCQARYRDETHELKTRINSLEAELRRQRLDKEGNTTSSSKESLEVLQQEVRDMSVKLEQKDNFCRELENELATLHSWIKAHAYHPSTSLLYGYRPHRSDHRTVIQSVQLLNGVHGNSPKSPPKSNGLTRQDSSDEDV